MCDHLPALPRRFTFALEPDLHGIAGPVLLD